MELRLLISRLVEVDLHCGSDFSRHLDSFNGFGARATATTEQRNAAQERGEREKEEKQKDKGEITILSP